MPSSSCVPDPPILVHQSPTKLVFSPAPFLSGPISYYTLYGRVASGSNVKVRLNDHHLDGLGIEV